MPFDRLWDELDQAREPTPIHDQLWAETYAPKRTRWTLGEVGIALLVVAVLAGTVALACLTGGAK